MDVLWWLAPPLAATVLAMAWAAWRGRERDEAPRGDTDKALARLGSALERPLPQRGSGGHPAADPTHGVAVRKAPRAAPETGGRR